MILAPHYPSPGKALAAAEDRAEALGHRLEKDPFGPTRWRTTVTGITRARCSTCWGKADICKGDKGFEARGRVVWDSCRG